MVNTFKFYLWCCTFQLVIMMFLLCIIISDMDVIMFAYTENIDISNNNKFNVIF